VVLAANPAHLNATLRPIYGILSGTIKEIPPKIGSGSHVDVRDVAKVHVWAFEHPKEANGKRYIAAAGYGPPQGIADILRAEYKGTKIAEKITVGNPGHDYIGYNKETGEVDNPDYLPESSRPSGKRAADTMGITWIPFKQSVIETTKMFETYL
jgi:nucleoside-diphosphate-sugar epimerase